MIENEDSFTKGFEIGKLPGRAESTKKAYKYVIQRFLIWADSEHVCIQKILITDIQKYANYLYTLSLSNKTIISQINIIKKYIMYNMNKNLIPDFLASPIIKNRHPRNHPNSKYCIKAKILTEGDIKVLEDKISDANCVRDIVMINMLLCTGMRVSELRDLKIDDFQVNERKGDATITVHEYKNLDASKQDYSKRELPITSRCRDIIIKYISQRDDLNPYLLINSKGQSISIRGIQEILSKYGVTANQFRHTVRMNLLKSGVDVNVISKFIGHCSPEMVLGYYKRDVDQAEIVKSIKNFIEYNK